MASRAAQLAIQLTEDGASQVASGLDGVTSSASRMGDTVESAGKQAKSAGDRMDTAAGGADEMASKGSQAAGAMGGLGDLIGGKFGAAMATGGVGLQAMADSGDLLNAALENSVVANLRAKAGVVAKTIADKAAAVATKTMTIAQKALNLAQRASPIGLIITAVLLLGTLFVVLYTRSDKFRAIVDRAMKVARAGAAAVVKGFQLLGSAVLRVMQLIARVVVLYVKVYVTAFQLGLKAAQLAWRGIQAIVTTVVGFVTRKVTTMKADLGRVWSGIKTGAVNAFKALTAPIQHLVDLVQSLLDKISSIHIPGSGAIGGLIGKVTGSNDFRATTSDATRVVTGDVVTIPITIQGGATAAQADVFMASVDARLRSLGKRPVFSP